MKNIVIVINGYPGCGTDTFVSKVYSLIDEDLNIKLHNISSVIPAKMIHMYIHDKFTIPYSEIGKSNKYRECIQDLKKLTDKYFGLSNVFLYDKLRNIIDCWRRNKNIIFVHIREPYNITKFIENFTDENVNNPENFVIRTLYIEREGYKIDKNGLCDSDRDVKFYDYDYQIILKTGKDDEKIGKIIGNEAEKFINNLLGEFGK